jgi:diacylglycerol kinase (ATP)
MINLRLLLKSFRFAFDGLFYVIKTQNNARIHLVATLLVIILSLSLDLSVLQWCAIIFSISIVWIAECFNTALEKLFDLVESKPNPLVKAGKDSGAAAVLVSAVLSISIGLFVLLPPLILKISLLFNN